MKLMLIIVRDEDADPATQELIQHDYRVTRMASTGGFLRRGNSTLLVGVEDDRVEDVTGLLQNVCRPSDNQQRRATIFILNMHAYTKI
jgi:uncharacterized protein YaaQ